MPCPPAPPKSNVPIFALRSTRLRIALLLMLGLFCATSMRVNLSMAVVCMVNSTAFEKAPSLLPHLQSSNEQCNALQPASVDSGYDGTLLWTPQQISLLLSATFYAGLLTIWWSGTLADRVGPKLVLFAGVADATLMTALTPFLASQSFYAVFAARLIFGLGEGFIFPCISSMAARWFPPLERSTYAAIYTSGNQLAGIFALLVSSYLCGTSFLGGWPSIFYLFASFGCIWAIFWFIFASDSPERNAFISSEEVLYIRQQTAGQRAPGAKAGSRKLSTAPVPWKYMASSTAIYANLIAQFSFNFSASLLQTYLPTYMRQVLKVELSRNGFYAMLPFLTQLISKNIFGILSDTLRRHGVLSNTAAVKIFQCFGNIGAGCCFLILAIFIDCTQLPLAVTALALYGMFFSAGICGFFTSTLSIAPSFTGTLMSIAMVAGTLGNAASPGVVGLVNKYGTEREWTFIWSITAAVNFVAAAVYIIFGSADIQPWALPKPLPSESPVSAPAPEDEESAEKSIPAAFEVQEPTDATAPADTNKRRSRRISEVSVNDFN